MICRLVDFALLVPKLLMSKICRIIGISKIKFLHFSSTEMVKQNQKSLKTNSNLLHLYSIIFQVVSTKSKYSFWLFTKTLTLLLPILCWVGDNTKVPLNSSILKIIRKHIPFKEKFFYEYSIRFLTLCQLKVYFWFSSY